MGINLRINKRQKIIISSVILALGLLSTQMVPIYLTYRFIGVLAVLALLLSIWSLWEGLNGLKAVVLTILPLSFTLAVSSYYFLLPVSPLIRIPVAIFFGCIFYTLLLSQNVFNVASIRTIPLYRVASTTVFVLTLITAYLLFNVIFAFNLLYLWNGILVFGLSFPLVLQLMWSIEMEGLNKVIILYSVLLALLVGEVAIALSFWPISKSMASLCLATALYITLGISTHYLRERLNRVAVWEYLGWGGAIFLVAFFTTSWSG